VAGFMIVGAAYTFFGGQDQRWLSLVGLGAVLFGLLVQHKRRDRPDAP
jgi:LPXTG-motif cell wall-anchored protein